MSVLKPFIDVYLRIVKTEYIKYQGRLSRSDFWHFFAVLFTVAVVLILGMHLFIGNILGTVFGILYLVWALGNLVPNVCATIRRLHDIGYSGWFILIGLIPIVGLILIFWLILPSKTANNPY